jgi:hypothetical protein
VWPPTRIASTRPPRLGEAVALLTAAGVREPERFVASAPRALLERGSSAVAAIVARPA